MRVKGGAGKLPEAVYLFHEVFAAADYAAHDVAVPAQEFGGAVHDQVGPKRDRRLIDGRGKGVVNDGYGAHLVGRGDQTFQVQNLYGRIGR